MLTYLLGDVLRIFSGDFKPGEVDGKKIDKRLYFGMAIFMIVPVIMVFFSLILPDQINRWTNIVIAGVFFLFNLAGLPTYTSLYDKFLIIVGLIFNLITVWYAWNWITG